MTGKDFIKLLLLAYGFKLMFNIVHIIDWMNQLGFEPTYSIAPGQEYSVKELLQMKI